MCPLYTLAPGPSFAMLLDILYWSRNLSRKVFRRANKVQRGSPTKALGALKRRGQARTGTAGPRGRSWALRPASARGLKYYPGVFNYLFLMDLQGLFHQARGGWVWGCGERAVRARAGKMAHISILKPFTIVSSMKDAANKTEPPAPASPSRKF